MQWCHLASVRRHNRIVTIYNIDCHLMRKEMNWSNKRNNSKRWVRDERFNHFHLKVHHHVVKWRETRWLLKQRWRLHDHTASWRMPIVSSYPGRMTLKWSSHKTAFKRQLIYKIKIHFHTFIADLKATTSIPHRLSTKLLCSYSTTAYTTADVPQAYPWELQAKLALQ